MNNSMLQGKEGFRGVWIPTITPINDNDDLMRSTISSHYEYLSKFGRHLGCSITGIMPLSVIGEFASLTMQEKVDVLRTLGQEGGRLKIVPFIIGNSIKNILRLIETAENAGADGMVLTTPYFFPSISNEMLYQFILRAISESRLPFLLYNKDNPFKIPISTHLIRKLSENKRFMGIIDNGSDVNYINSIKKEFSDLVVLSGAEKQHREWLKNGADGIVSWLGNVYPSLTCELVSMVESGDEQASLVFNDKLNCLIDLISQYPMPDVIKYALFQRGFPSMTTRMPLEHLAEDERSKLKTDLKRYLHQNFAEQLKDLFCES
jgi:4-hydroxy-tetrahydrodipicolinate synthase/2-dehydro-3-deoxy-phosphogluconate/2-dehydro-3-deoxy-6-phosphogalactonate aldolase